MEDNKQVIVAVQTESESFVAELISQFPGAEIATEEDLVRASDALTRITKQLKAWDSKRTELVKPANDWVRNINEVFRKVTEPVKHEEGRIRQMMSTWRAKIQAERARKYAEDQKKAESAFPDGSPIPEVVAPIPEDTIRQVETENGKVGFTTVWKYQIVDAAQIPAEYWMIDETKISKVVKAGIRNIPGVKIYAEEVPATRMR